MQTFEFQGQSVAYTRNGKGAPVVFLHNGGTSHSIWDEVAGKISVHREVFALDLPGYGESSKPGTGYELGNYVRLIEKFVRAHALAPVTLVGNCMGSAISLSYARTHPEAVRALVLVNPLTEATFAAGSLGTIRRFDQSAPRLASWAFGLAAHLRLPRWSAGPVISMQLGGMGRAAGVARTPFLREAHASRGQLRSLLGVVEDFDSYAALDSFSPGPDFPPICTIWGIENRILSADAGMELNRTLRPRRQEWLEGCGHLCMMERPAAVTEIIEDFLNNYERGRGEVSAAGKAEGVA